MTIPNQIRPSSAIQQQRTARRDHPFPDAENVFVNNSGGEDHNIERGIRSGIQRTDPVVRETAKSLSEFTAGQRPVEQCGSPAEILAVEAKQDASVAGTDDRYLDACK